MTSLSILLIAVIGYCGFRLYYGNEKIISISNCAADIAKKTSININAEDRAKNQLKKYLIKKRGKIR